MARRPRAVCSCGAELKEPLPRVCPACGERIVRVRRVIWRPIASFLLIAALAAALLAYGWWLLS